MTNEERSKLKYEEIKLKVEGLKENFQDYLYLLSKQTEKERQESVSFRLKCYEKFVKVLKELALSEPDYRKFYEIWLVDVCNLSSKLIMNEVLENTHPQKMPLQPRQIEKEPTKSFKYNKSDQQKHIENIFKMLKGNLSSSEFILSDVKLNNFKNIFYNQALTKINLIDWQRSIASLRY